MSKRYFKRSKEATLHHQEFVYSSNNIDPLAKINTHLPIITRLVLRLSPPPLLLRRCEPN
jgi:hypothetical protein